MTVSSSGSGEVSRYMQGIPAQMRKLLRGAGRAAARVVADEAKVRCVSSQVRDDIKVESKAEDDFKVVAKVVVKGRGAFIAPWLEYGTDPHFISIAADQRGGMSVRKANERVKAGSLVINGKFVGDTVWHPGAKPHPFLRPALDVKEGEAIAAAQGYINARISRSGIAAGASDGDEA